jgi:hypothetical protein
MHTCELESLAETSKNGVEYPLRIMPVEEFGEVGFTSKDRENLITLLANFGNMSRAMDQMHLRVVEIKSEFAEQIKVHARQESVDRLDSDLKTQRLENRQLAEEVRSRLEEDLRQQRSDQLTLAQEFRDKVDRLEMKVAWAYGFAAAFGVLSTVLIKLIWK